MRRGPRVPESGWRSTRQRRSWPARVLPRVLNRSPARALSRYTSPHVFPLCNRGFSLYNRGLCALQKRSLLARSRAIPRMAPMRSALLTCSSFTHLTLCKRGGVLRILVYLVIHMTLGRCPMSIFCSRGTPPRVVRIYQLCTFKTVKARFRPWLSGESPCTLSSYPIFAAEKVSRTCT